MDTDTALELAHELRALEVAFLIHGENRLAVSTGNLAAGIEERYVPGQQQTGGN